MITFYLFIYLYFKTTQTFPSCSAPYKPYLKMWINPTICEKGPKGNSDILFQISFFTRLNSTVLFSITDLYTTGSKFVCLSPIMFFQESMQTDHCNHWYGGILSVRWRKKRLGSAEMLILNRYCIRSQFCDTSLQNDNSNTNSFVCVQMWFHEIFLSSLHSRENYVF